MSVLSGLKSRMRTALFWDFMQRLLVLPTFRYNLSVPSSKVKKWTLDPSKRGRWFVQKRP